MSRRVCPDGAEVRTWSKWRLRVGWAWESEAPAAVEAPARVVVVVVQDGQYRLIPGTAGAVAALPQPRGAISEGEQ